MTRLNVIKSSASDLDALAADYIATKRGRGQWGPRTEDLNSNVLQRIFIPWCVESGITAPDQLSQRIIDRFSAALLERVDRGELKRESVRTYVRTTGSFLKWASGEGAIANKVKAYQPKAERKLLETLSRQQIQKLEDRAELERDKLMVRLLADSGIRLSELRALRGSDLTEHGRERFLKINGKGSKQRLVPVAPALFTRLKRYADRGGERIFMTVRKSPKTGQLEPLASRSIQNTLAFLGKAAGIEIKVRPHLLRHSMATDWLRKKKSPFQLKVILGHSSMVMIDQVYSHLLPSDSYEAMLDYLRAEES